jgi:AbrB family looped-hinge helix DNA binding protein
MNYQASKSLHGKIVSGGRLQLPAEVRRAMGLSDGDTVVMELKDGKLHIRSYRDVIKGVQDRFRPYIPDGVSAVDALIADRRAEAERE